MVYVKMFCNNFPSYNEGERIFTSFYARKCNTAGEQQGQYIDVEIADICIIPCLPSPPSSRSPRAAFIIMQEAIAAHLNSHLEGDKFVEHFLPLDPKGASFSDNFRDGIFMCRLVCLAIPGTIIGDQSAYRGVLPRCLCTNLSPVFIPPVLIMPVSLHGVYCPSLVSTRTSSFPSWGFLSIATVTPPAF